MMVREAQSQTFTRYSCKWVARELCRSWELKNKFYPDLWVPVIVLITGAFGLMCKLQTGLEVQRKTSQNLLFSRRLSRWALFSRKSRTGMILVPLAWMVGQLSHSQWERLDKWLFVKIRLSDENSWSPSVCVRVCTYVHTVMKLPPSGLSKGSGEVKPVCP